MEAVDLGYNPAVITGSDAEIYVNGKKILYATDCSWNYNYNVTPIRGIGSWQALGAISTHFEGSIDATVHLFAEREDGVPKLPAMEEILTSGPLLWEFRQKQSGRRIGRAILKLNSDGGTMSANQYTSRRLNFYVVRWQPLEAYH